MLKSSNLLIVFVSLLFLQVAIAKDISIDFYTHKNVNQISAVEDLIDSVDFSNRKMKLRGTAIAKENSTFDTDTSSISEDNFFMRNANSVVFIQTDKGEGSGIILEKDKIITNWHVIFDAGINEVKVVFKPRTGNTPVPTQAHIAEVVRCDSTSDLALLKPRWPPEEIQPAVLANEKIVNEILISNKVHTIGHPGGGSTWSYAMGTISQIIKNKTWKYGPPFNSAHLADSIQTQTPINPGNSGGPLFLDDGRIIGVVVSGCDRCENIGNAIAISSVHNFLESNINECEPLPPPPPPEKTLLSEYDRDGDGVVDIKSFDMTGSGIVNWIHLDNTDPNDGWFEILLYDKDENGIFETQVYFPQYKDEPIVSYYDHDQDEMFDVCGIDIDGDGKDDRQMAYASCMTG